jgi:hypothetical protein
MWRQVRRECGKLQCFRIVVAVKSLNKNWPVCWSIVVKEKPTVGSQFFGAFLSDSIPKGTKDVKVHLFIQDSNSRKLYQRITGTFCSYYVCMYVCVHTCKKESCKRYSLVQRVSGGLGSHISRHSACAGGGTHMYLCLIKRQSTSI